MGVDCNLYLPDNVSIDHVSKAMGLAAGCDRNWEKEDRWVEVHGVKIQTCETVPGMVTISIKGTRQQHAYYFFECEYGGRCLSARSTAQFIALARKVADCFGGFLVYQDSNDEGTFFRPYENPRPRNGAEWKALQDRLWAIEPITEGDIADARPRSAYDRKAA